LARSLHASAARSALHTDSVERGDRGHGCCEHHAACVKVGVIARPIDRLFDPGHWNSPYIS
jgi:hypothetical protein